MQQFDGIEDEVGRFAPDGGVACAQAASAVGAAPADAVPVAAGEGSSAIKGGPDAPLGGTASKDRLWSLTFIVIVCCSLCCFLVGQGSNAGTSVYLERMGLSTELAGIGAMVFSLSAAVARIVSGALLDSKGRLPLLIAGSAVMLAGAVGPLFDQSGSLLILWRALQGLGFSIGTTAAATAAADVLPASRLGEGIGYYGLGQAISMSVGPALAIFLISTDPPENFYAGLTVCSVAALAFALSCRYERNPSSLPQTSEYRVRYESGNLDATTRESDAARFSLREGIIEPAALHGAVPMMFISVAFGFGIFFIGVFGNSIGVGSSGMFFTVAAISMIAVRLVSGGFMDKVAPIAIMGVAVICGLISYGALLFCEVAGSGSLSEIVFYAAGLPYGVSLGVSLPINQSVAVKLSPPSRWGAANGLFLLANDVAIGMASLAFGFTVSAFGYVPTFAIIMVCIALSFLVALAMYPKQRG